MNANNENNYPNTNYPDFTNNTASGTQDDLTSSDLLSSDHSQKQTIISNQQESISENLPDTNNNNGG